MDARPHRCQLYAKETDAPSFHRCLAQAKVATILLMVDNSSTPNSHTNEQTAIVHRIPIDDDSPAPLPLHRMSLEELLQTVTAAVVSTQTVATKKQPQVHAAPTTTAAMRSVMSRYAIQALLLPLLPHNKIRSWSAILANAAACQRNTSGASGACESCAEKKGKDEWRSFSRARGLFTLQHDTTFSSVCIEEKGGVLWSKCQPWLVSLLQTTSNQQNQRKRVAARIQGWITTCVEKEEHSKSEENGRSGGEGSSSSGGGSSTVQNEAMPTRQQRHKVYLIDGVAGGVLKCTEMLTSPAAFPTENVLTMEASQLTARGTWDRKRLEYCPLKMYACFFVFVFTTLVILFGLF